MTEIPSEPPRVVVIATPDSKLRSSFAAQLVQRGENVISVINFRSPKISDRARANALLVVAEETLPDGPWLEPLREYGWGGQILVIGAEGSDPDETMTAGVHYCSHPFDIQACLDLL
ncbi:hypothetical protein [Sphingomonas immobilis]|uniref:Uncharacterized protein n=1 Tax=Sphingomonas immobilis TaxID=3063997 RepID=A0ABT9A4A5_9SPHN|nr:hypothetical protein [Sphingomonas sp. CA1-15]MDO7844645.1 hypothetical protein [Sphingomonas sp. CA1-15]